jgi:hypothetical protein
VQTRCRATGGKTGAAAVEEAVVVVVVRSRQTEGAGEGHREETATVSTTYAAHTHAARALLGADGGQGRQSGRIIPSRLVTHHY